MTLASLRQQIVDALETDGIPTSPYMAEMLFAPVAVVKPAYPYVTLQQGAVAIERFTARYEVLLFVSRADNETTANEIDSMVETAVLALEDDWDITEVSEPQQVSLQGTPTVCALLTLETTTNFEKEAN